MSRMDIAYDYFMSGMSSHEAAKVAGVSAYAFAKWRMDNWKTFKKSDKLKADAEQVCAAWADAILNATGEDVRVRTRRREVAWLRQALILAMYRDGHSYPNIAGCFGMDHTTCLHAVEVAGACDIRRDWAAAIVEGRLDSICLMSVTVANASKAEAKKRDDERKTFNELAVKDILARHKAGETLEEIAVSYGRSRAWPSLVLKNAGISIRASHSALPDNVVDQIVCMASAGLSDREIARTLGIKSDTARRYRRRAGIATQHNVGPRTEPKPWGPQDDKEMVKLSSDGLSASQIGARLGRSRNSVCGRADRLGISLAK